MAGANPIPAPTWENLFYPPAGYRYFQQALPEPVTPEPSQADPVSAAFLADVAMLAYARDGKNPIPWPELKGILAAAGFPNAEPLGSWSGNGGGTQAFFAWNPHAAMLSFRGTEKGDPRDTLADLRVLPVDEGDPPAKVHCGFQRALNEIWSSASARLAAYRKEHPQGEICFTGHSLGGALAVLAASRFTGGGASVYTFGCPRVGNKALVDRALERAERGCFRFVNDRDLVTNVPLETQWYSHGEQTCFEIGVQGDVPILNVSGPPELLADHSPGRYCYYMWKRALAQPS